MIDNEISRALDILDKFDFFQGQRAGRELWSEKPFDIQEEDVKSFSADVKFLKEFINRQMEEIESRDKRESYLFRKIHERDSEIEKWKAECENQSVLWRDHFESIFESAKETVRAKAIKEFAERLKEAFSDLEFEYDPKLRIVKVEEVKSLVDWALHKISIETIQDAAKDISGN